MYAYGVHPVQSIRTYPTGMCLVWDARCTYVRTIYAQNSSSYFELRMGCTMYVRTTYDVRTNTHMYEHNARTSPTCIMHAVRTWKNTPYGAIFTHNHQKNTPYGAIFHDACMFFDGIPSKKYPLLEVVFNIFRFIFSLLGYSYLYFLLSSPILYQFTSILGEMGSFLSHLWVLFYYCFQCETHYSLCVMVIFGLSFTLHHIFLVNNMCFHIYFVGFVFTSCVICWLLVFTLLFVL